MKNTLKTSALKGVLLVGMVLSLAECDETFTDPRDGQTYKTVKIGSQIWMAENLNYEFLGSYSVEGDTENLNCAYSEGTARSYCYGNDPTNCEKYDRLYTWSAAMDSAAVFGDGGKGCGYGVKCTPTYPVRGACPEGWHLPSNAEWDTR